MMLPSGNDAAQALAIYFGGAVLTNGLDDPNNLTILNENAIKIRVRLQTIKAAYEYQRSIVKKWRDIAKQAKIFD
jgi:hypothetical protein